MSVLDIPWVVHAVFTDDAQITVHQRACYDTEDGFLQLRQWSTTDGTPLDGKVFCEASMTLNRSAVKGEVDLLASVRTECIYDSWMLRGVIEDFAHDEHFAWFKEFSLRLMRNAADPHSMLQSDSAVSAAEKERAANEGPIATLGPIATERQENSADKPGADGDEQLIDDLARELARSIRIEVEDPLSTLSTKELHTIFHLQCVETLKLSRSRHDGGAVQRLSRKDGGGADSEHSANAREQGVEENRSCTCW